MFDYPRWSDRGILLAGGVNEENERSGLSTHNKYANLQKRCDIFSPQGGYQWIPPISSTSPMFLPLVLCPRPGNAKSGRGKPRHPGARPWRQSHLAPHALGEDAAQSQPRWCFGMRSNALRRVRSQEPSLLSRRDDVRVCSPGSDDILAVWKKMAPGHALDTSLSWKKCFTAGA